MTTNAYVAMQVKKWAAKMKKQYITKQLFHEGAMLSFACISTVVTAWVFVKQIESGVISWIGLYAAEELSQMAFGGYMLVELLGLSLGVLSFGFILRRKRRLEKQIDLILQNDNEEENTE